MIKMIESTGGDFGLGTLELVTARLVSELEARDDKEEAVMAAQLHGLMSGERKKKKFCSRPRDTPSETEPVLPNDNDTER